MVHEKTALSFEEISEADIPEVTKVMTLAFDDDAQKHLGQEHGGPEGYDNGEFFRKWLFGYDESDGYKVVHEGQIIGATIVWILADGHNLVGTVFVAPAFQDRGIGTRLWHFIETRYPETKSWGLATPDWAIKNHHFYESKCGFQRVESHPVLGAPEDSFVYRKEMQSGESKLRLDQKLLAGISLTLLFLLIFAAIGTQSATAADSDIAEPLTPETVEAFFDNMLAQQVVENHVVGATVSVVKDGELLFAKGYGYADLEQQIPVVADKTLFFPGSAGKLFTWTALMQLVEQGEIALTDDVNQYLNFVIPATFPEPITIEHLLTHTSGFEEQLAALLVADQSDVLPSGEFLERTLPARVYAPGTTFGYSNYATVLAGHIVEHVSGQPFEQYVTDHILTPLEMTRSSAYQPLPADLMADFTKGYHHRNGVYTTVDFEWIANAPAAPIRTTATDMAKFMIAHLNGGQFGETRILEEETCAAMQRRQFSHDPRVNGMGYGFMISEQNGKTIAWHTGGSAHINTMLALIPAENVGFFVSYNTPVHDLYQPLVSFVDHFYPQPVAAPSAPPADTAEWIAALSGSYVSSRVAHQSPQKLVTWQAEALTVRPGADNTLHVGPRTYREVEPGLFQQVDGPRTLTYRTDADGQVTQIFWGQFAYFKVPWYRDAGNQLIMAAVALLILLTAGLAWSVDWFIQRRGEGAASSRWSRFARWGAVGLGLLNVALFAWFLVLLLGFAETYVFPVATVTLLTWLWWINVPAVAVLLFFTVLAWRNHTWRPAWRLHYTVVTLASVAFVAFLANWNLLAGL